MKLIKKLFIAYFIFLSLALFSLYFSFLIKSNNFDNNTNRSIKTFEAEGIYPSFGLSSRKIVLDNFTDSLMLNTAFSVSNNAIDYTMFNERGLKSQGENNQILNLKASYEKNYTATSSYERYWHGYLIFIRPFLSIISYQEIRIILTISLFSAYFYLLFLLFKSKEYSKILALVLASFAVDLFYLGQSIQFSQVFLIGVFSSIYYLKRNNKLFDLYLLFFIIGMMTSFFDLLTAPLVTLGFLLLISNNNEKIIKLIKKCLAWGFGYILFWTSKWIILETFFYRGAINNAFTHVLNRSINQADQDFSHIRAILLNVKQLIGYDMNSKTISLLLFLILLLVFLFFRKKKINYLKILYWAVFASIPYIFYLLAANHSYLHVWYTYRAQFISVSAGFMAYLNLIDKKKLKLFIRKITFKSS